jgi:hypothetical protein
MKALHAKGTRRGYTRRLFGITSEFSHFPHAINVRQVIRIGTPRTSGNPGVDPVRKTTVPRTPGKLARRIWRRIARLALHAKAPRETALSTSR